MKLYILGKITGDENYKDKFEKAHAQLAELGYSLENPSLIFIIYDDLTWADYVRHAIQMLLKCDGVALLPDWWKSKESRIERRLALSLGMPVKLIDKWERIK